MRGGEWVLDRLARKFGPTTLYTLVDARQPLTPAIRACRVQTSFIQNMPGGAGRLRRWYLPLMMRAVDSLRVRPCDLLISTSSAVMKSIQPPAGTPHLCYCHSPARYVWGQMHEYGQGSGGGLRSVGLRAIRERFRQWDRAACSRVTRFLANSEHTARKIRTFYGCEAFVVYPPVRTRFFTPDASMPREDWYLLVSALEPYKRVDLVMRAARQFGFPLKVVGTGSQQGAAARMAGGNIEYLGRVDDETLRDLYRRARALIHPQLEDFGIIACEAQACGCPVIAFAQGGALETVTNDTGLLFHDQTIAGVAEGVRAFERELFDARAVRANAERFSEDAFDRAIESHVRELLEGRREDRARESSETMRSLHGSRI